MDSRVASFAVPGSRAAAASDPKQWIPESAQGATLRIAGGSELIDFASGGFRHSDPRLRARVEEQLRRLPLSGRVFFSRPLAELCRTLADLAPGDLEVSFPCNSGAEAIEGALKLAKGYAGSSRSHFVATHSAWHGATTAALGVCGIDAVREAMGVSPVHARFVPYGDVEALRAAVDRGTIAVLIEAIATSPGVQVPPRGYLSAVRDACRASGALLIVDELVTGVGVTGRLFAVDEEEVAPDILVLGGVLGGAMLPMALYIASRRVNDAVYRRSDPVLHGTTTGGNPAACVAALATLERVREERLVDGAAESGRTIAAALEELRAEFPELAVAGRGLLAAVRAPSARQALAIRSAGLEAGVLLRIDGGAAGEAWIGIRPPLGIRSDELALGLRATQTAFRRGLGAAGVAA